MNRDKLVDSLKGYACILVVFGHVIMGIRKAGAESSIAFYWLERFIWTFHVQLFMFLSGYVYYINGEWTKQKKRSSFILHKVINLGIPYIVFSIVYILINSIVSSTNTDYSLKMILIIWKEPVAQYWFIYALIWLFVVWSLGSKFFTNMQILFICLIINVCQKCFSLEVGLFSSMLSSSFAFGLGVCCHRLKIPQLTSYKKAALIVVHFLFSGLFVIFEIDNFFVDKLEIVIGITGSIALISILYKNEFIKKFLLWINEYSFPIYLLHTIFTACIRIVLFKVGISNYFIHVVLGMLLGILCPTVIAVVSKKSVYSDFFFYPNRTIKRIRQQK